MVGLCCCSSLAVVSRGLSLAVASGGLSPVVVSRGLSLWSMGSKALALQ